MTCESQEQEAGPFSSMDSCHERTEGSEVGVRTWKLKKDERKAEERQSDRDKEEKETEKA